METRFIQKPSSRFVEYLNAYLSDTEFKNLELNAKKAKDDQVKKLEIYKKEFDVYSQKIKIYKKEQEEYKKKRADYTQALEAYKINPVPPKPIEPVAPKAPLSPVYPVLNTDPRIKSREELHMALKGNAPSHLSRLLNQLVLKHTVTEKEKDKAIELSAVDDKVIDRIFPEYSDIQDKGQFEYVSDGDKRILKVDAATQTKAKQFAADITFYGCQELLDQKGQLHQDIIHKLKLHEVEKKWTDDQKPELIAQILPQVLFGYCSQVILGTLHTNSLKPGSEQKNSGLGLAYLQDQLYEMDENKQGRPTEFFLDQIAAYRFYQSVVTSLEKLPHHQITAIVHADVSCREQHTPQQEKLITDVKMVFWKNVIHYMSLRQDWSTEMKPIAQAIQRGFVDQLHHSERVISYPSLSREFTRYLQARDNIWLLDRFVSFANEKKYEIPAKQLEYIATLKTNSEKLKLPIVDIIFDMQTEFKANDDEFTYHYFDEISSITERSEREMPQESKKRELRLNVYRLHQHTLPAQDTTLKTDSEIQMTSFKHDDPEGNAYENLVNDIQEWKRKNYTTALDWYVKWRHNHKVYSVYHAENPADESLENLADQHERVIEEKATHHVKEQLMGNLLQTLIRESQKTPPPPLKKVIDDWKEEKVGPYYLDSKATGQAYETHYEVLGIQTGVSKGMSDTQTVIHNALQKIAAQVAMKKQGAAP